MKRYFFYIISFLLLCTSIGLYIRTKKLASMIIIVQDNMSKAIDNNKELEFSYTKLQKVFNINLKTMPLPLGLNIETNTTNKLQLILYLKPHACTPCNMAVIQNLINHLKNETGFRIYSHASNRYFISLLELDGQTIDKVEWIDEKLYDYANAGFDAELLLIMEQNLIVGVIPVELLKDDLLFENVTNEVTRK